MGYLMGMVTVLLGLSFSTAVRDRQLYSGSSQIPASYQLSDITIIDKDGNKKPEPEVLSGTILVRIETMPSDSDLQAPNIHENNLVFFPYIVNPSGNEMVVVSLTFNHNRACPDYVGVGGNVQCKNYIRAMLVPMAANEDLNTLTVTDLESRAAKVMNLSAGAGNTVIDNNVDEKIIIPASSAGYRLVIHDEGASFTIKHVTIDRFYCRQNVLDNQLLLTCPVTPGTIARNTTVTCTCAAPNSQNPPEGPITKICVYEASDAYFKDLSSHQLCECQPGYHYTPIGDLRECRPAPATSPAPTSQTSTPATQKSLGSQSTQIATSVTVAPSTTAGPSSQPVTNAATTPQSSNTGQSGGISVTSKSSPTGPTPTVNDKTTSGAPAASVNKLTTAVISVIAMSLLFKLM